ncbi:uncharacterized protein RCO7_10325 [Rhynchosporium graminicola]|uniref:Uncharacterized protein n=1 Tax=Rhynchosporium graminicola TaxID=2792576 RepID=A0A1E1K8G7_9HELO|nr:uncharacterized protein RCO7_10325 [Rhynchosporium commune]
MTMDLQANDSAGDAIPFWPALIFSLVVLGVCSVRLVACCLLPERTWRQLGICSISTIVDSIHLILETVEAKLQWIILVAGTVLSILALGFSLWYSMAISPFIPTLSANIVEGINTQRSSWSSSNDLSCNHVFILHEPFQAGSASSILMATTNGILLVVNLVGLSPKDLGLWILCVISSVCTFRFALWKWGKKFFTYYDGTIGITSGT